MRMIHRPPDSKETLLADLELAREAIRGRTSATDELFRRLECVPRMVAALNRRMGHPFADADQADVTQDILVGLWKKLSTFEGRSRLETWAHGYCYFVFMNKFRKSTRHRTLSVQEFPGLDERLASPPEPGPLDFEDLEAALLELGPPEEEIIRLKHEEGFTFREVGARLQISPNSAKTHYYRGLEWLRQRLAPKTDGSPR